MQLEGEVIVKVTLPGHLIGRKKMGEVIRFNTTRDSITLCTEIERRSEKEMEKERKSNKTYISVTLTLRERNAAHPLFTQTLSGSLTFSPI
ncbi:hypothetical protein E2C01_004552 [Portunus trituberculatus]|uniref:Uncharacterized protein n=1 Tax=Portunus trituberculatus TaxID=210409 RepID=A0A5B7CQ12_PORTR|nr:hypothetical protein [Portunus trituberculatus]